MNDRDAWTREQRLWLKGADTYRALLDEDCIMAFPAPVGLMQGRETIVASLEGAPRWESVTMTEKTSTRPGGTSLVLGYRAEARRTEGQAYIAYCTSTYRAIGIDWKLIQHQQTPAP
jgi:hypothetical protein